MPKYILQQVVTRKPKQEGNYETQSKHQQNNRKSGDSSKNFYKM